MKVLHLKLLFYRAVHFKHTTYFVAKKITEHASSVAVVLLAILRLTFDGDGSINLL
jgi:hypothetical protein